MEHYKSRNNDFFHFTNPHDDVSEIDDDDGDDYDELQYYDVDDDRSCDFSFHDFRPIGLTSSPARTSQTSGVMNQNDTATTSMEEFGTFDKGDLIFHLDNTMKNLSDKLQHTIEGIGTQISCLDDETYKLNKHVEDVKNFAENYHGTTHTKLRQMHNVLQEVQDGVLFLRDKHEIAETQIQLAKLQGLKTDKVTASQTPLLNQQPSNQVALPQVVSYHPDPQFPHFTQSYQPNSFQGVVSPQNLTFSSHPSQEPPKISSFSYSSLQHSPFEEGLLHLRHVQPSRNYKSEFSAKYMPEFASFSDTHELSDENPNGKTVNFSIEPQEESNYTRTPVAQQLPHALFTADDVEDGSKSEEIGNKIPVDDIVDKVTTMGFRRDLVRACVRKLTDNGSSVDLNAVLDRMMNNK